MRMSRVVVAMAALALTVIPAGCQKTVEVQTGTRVVCTNGETISDSTRTLTVPAKVAQNYKVTVRTRTCDRHAQAAQLYAQAQELIKAGDLKSAAATLQKVVAIDQAYAQAAQQLKMIEEGGAPAADTTPDDVAEEPEAPAKPGEGDTGVPSGSLLVWAPDDLDGYTAAKPTIDVLNIAREYAPASGDVTSLVIVAEQSSTSTGAKKALEQQITSRYRVDAEKIKVGDHAVWMGTDGRRFAAIGFTDGSVMVAIEMSVAPGKDPKGLKDDLVAVAKQLP